MWLTRTDTRLSIPIILSLVFLLFGLHLRIVMISSGLPYVGQVDEIVLLQRSLNIIQTGDLNPHFFNYPSLPIYLTSAGLLFGYYSSSTHLEIENPEDIGPLNYPYYSNARIVMPIKVLFATLSIFSIFFLSFAGYKYFKLPSIIIPITTVVSLLSERYFFYSQAYLNVDIVACFWIASIYLVFACSKNRDSFFFRAIIPGILSGFAIASKYNMIFCVIPSMLIIILYSNFKLQKLSVFFLFTGVSFLLVVPFSLLDFHTFIDHLGQEVYHYSNGHIGFQGETGLFQAKHYIMSLVNDFGIASSIFALAGILYSFVLNWKKAIVFITFPSTLLIFMCQLKVNFLRNIIFLYLLYSLFVAMGIIGIFRLVLFLMNRYGTNTDLIKISSYLLGIVMILTASIFFPFKRGAVWLNVEPDTRKAAIDWVSDNIPRGAKLILPEEFSIDVRMIEDSYKITRLKFLESEWEPLVELLDDKENIYFIIPYFGYDLRKPAGKEIADNLNTIVRELNEIRCFTGKCYVTPEADIFSAKGLLVNYIVSVPERDPDLCVYKCK